MHSWPLKNYNRSTNTELEAPTANPDTTLLSLIKPVTLSCNYNHKSCSENLSTIFNISRCTDLHLDSIPLLEC